MDETIIVALLGFLGTVIGSAFGAFGGMKLMSYRIEQLEKKVEKHNNLIERMYSNEKTDAIQDETISELGKRVSDLENSRGENA